MVSERLIEAALAGFPLFDRLMAEQGQRPKPKGGGDLLFINAFGRSFSRSSLDFIKGIGKSAVTKSQDGNGYHVYIDTGRDGRYDTTEEYTEDEAVQLIVQLTRTVSEFCGSIAESDTSFDESGQEVDIERVRMVTLPGVVGFSLATDDIAHVAQLSLRYDGNNAYIDIQWSPSCRLCGKSMRVRDFKHTSGSTYDPAQLELAEDVFAKVVRTINDAQIAMGLSSLLKITPVKQEQEPVNQQIQPVGVDPGERGDVRE